MNIIEHYCEQNSTDWYLARMGMVTASEAATVMSMPIDKKSPTSTRRTYMNKLIGERITGEPMDTYTNKNMERGHEWEDQARATYELTQDVEVRQVGFIENQRLNAGCSPDGLVGDDGLIEIKTRAAHLMVDLLDKRETPKAHLAQVQCAMLVSGRMWCDLIVYNPHFPPFISRIDRDVGACTKIKAAINEFYIEMANRETRVREYGR